MNTKIIHWIRVLRLIGPIIRLKFSVRFGFILSPSAFFNSLELAPLSKSKAKGTKSEPRDSKSQPKGTQREPKGTKSEPADAKSAPTEAKREP